MKKISNINSSQYFNFEIFRNLNFWFLFILTLLVFSPAFLFDFGMHNDYTIRSKINVDWNSFFNTEAHPEYKNLHAFGRPINAFLQNFQYFLISDFEHLKIARFFSFTLFIICSLSSFLFFIYMKVDKLNALFASLIQLFVPSSQLFILWASNIVPGTIVHILGMFLGFIGSYILVFYDEISLKRLIFLSSILIFGSIKLFLIYPPNATIIITPIASIILFKPLVFSITQIKKLIFVILLICLGFIIGVIYIKFFNEYLYFILFDEKIKDFHYEKSFISIQDLFHRILAVANLILPSFFNPVQILSGPEYDYFFSFFFLLLIINFVLNRSIVQTCLMFCVILFLIIFSVSIHLVTKDIAIGIRNMHTTFLICALFFWRLFYEFPNVLKKNKLFHNKLAQVKIVNFAIFFIITIIPAAHNIYKASLNASLEYYFVKKELIENFDFNNKEIAVVLSKIPGKTIIGAFANEDNKGHFITNLSNEFKQMALNYSLMTGIINENLKDLGLNPSDYIIRNNPKNVNSYKNKIDFNKFILK